MRNKPLPGIINPKNDSPIRQSYPSSSQFGPFGPHGTAKEVAKHAAKGVVKAGVRGALGTAVAIPAALYSFGKESIRRKKADLSGFNIKKTPTNKPFTFNKSK